MNLVIVESPAKARKIGAYLGSNFKVKASCGHICNLDAKELSVVDGWKPQLKPLADKKQIISELQKLAKKAEVVYLASDPDREGEAIAADLARLLKPKVYKRMRYNAVTKEAILNALEEAGKINEHLVEAQHSRRVLDRLIGWKVSPVASNLLNDRLSAGRVQSVALKLIAEREEQIQSFNSAKYYQLVFPLNEKITAILNHYKEEKIEEKCDNKELLQTIADSLPNSAEILEIKKKEKREKPPQPLTTSSLQQLASSALKYSPKKTMSIAQKLYENGHITYMRSDSTRIEPYFIDELKLHVKNSFGEDYCNSEPHKQKVNSQDAHEAIRPTELNQSVEDEEQKALYELIEKYTLASVMSAAINTAYAMTLQADTALFSCSWNEQVFDGWRKLIPLGKLEKQKFVVGQKIPLKPCVLAKKTQPAARYSEASLIAKMEKAGIGRPATYASILENIKLREYIQLNAKRKLEATAKGQALVKFLEKIVPNFMELNFTAQMEKELDLIASGAKKSKDVGQNFYSELEETLAKVDKRQRWSIGEHGELIEADAAPLCPVCKQEMRMLKSKNGGFFWACTGYPECNKTLSCNEKGQLIRREYPKPTTHKCSRCAKTMLLRQGKTGFFLGCSGYPECKEILTCDKDGQVRERKKKSRTIKKKSLIYKLDID